MMPSASTMQQGLETNGKGLEKSGGNLSSKSVSTDPAKPVGRGGKDWA
jgi:hypothetical protein